MNAKFNANQQLALAVAEEGHNFLLLGSAGIGKSYVIREIVERLKMKGKTVALTCSTGVACLVYPEHLQVMALKDNRKFFGGMQVILCGDFLQLPPVLQTQVMGTVVAKDEGEQKVRLNQLTVRKILWLKIGIPVILLRNLTSRLVNGLKGTVLDIDERGPTIQFPGVTSILTKYPFEIFSPRLNKNVAVRTQFPIKPAFGLTIHKAQGRP